VNPRSPCPKLKEFFFSLDRHERDAFASNCGTTVGQIKQIAYGNRPCNPTLAINIDRESCGRVPCDELCPDVDWNYVRQQFAHLGDDAMPTTVAAQVDADNVQVGAA